MVKREEGLFIPLVLEGMGVGRGRLRLTPLLALFWYILERIFTWLRNLINCSEAVY